MSVLTVEFTDEQYARYKAAYKKVARLEGNPTDEQLIAQLKREAAAITYAAEIGSGNAESWAF